jgi:hypothetical protein
MSQKLEKETKINTAAKTIASMCVDYLSKGITVKNFSDNLSSFAKYIRNELCEECLHHNIASLADTSCSGCVDRNRFNSKQKD